MITLICGVGCAGKTTLSRVFDNVIHLDEVGLPWERYLKVNEKVAEINNDVVIEGIYNHADLRVDLLRAYNGVYAKCIWLNPPKNIIEEHSKKRHIPITKYHMNFEPPTFAEGWDEIIVIRGDDEQRYCRQDPTKPASLTADAVYTSY